MARDNSNDKNTSSGSGSDTSSSESNSGASNSSTSSSKSDGSTSSSSASDSSSSSDSHASPPRINGGAVRSDRSPARREQQETLRKRPHQSPSLDNRRRSRSERSPVIVDRQRRDHHDDRLPRDSRSRGSYRMEGRLNERSPGPRRRSPPYSRSQYQDDRRPRDRSPYMDRRPVKRERRDEFDHKQDRHRDDDHQHRPAAPQRGGRFQEQDRPRPGSREGPDTGPRDKRAGRWEPPAPKGEQWGKEGNRPPPVKEAKEVKPDFGLSGALADETNKVDGVTLVYSEPPEAANTNTRWRLYTFKTGELIGEPLYLHRQSCYLFGRERKVVDVPTDHPSCSKQHAVYQYRRTSKTSEEGMPVEAVRPYLMDLGSTNGTFINNERLEPQRFYELLEKDVMKMGNSSREYVLLHEGSLEA